MEDKLVVKIPFTLLDRFKAAFVLIPQRKLNLFIHSIIPCFGICIILLVLSSNKPVTIGITLLIVALFLFTPFFTILAVLISYFSNPMAREKFSYTFNSEGVHVNGENYDFTHKWSAIKSVKKTCGFLLLFYAPGLAHCLPLKYLNSDNSLEKIVLLARAQGIVVQ